MRPKNSAYRLAPDAAGTVKKNLPNPATGTSRASRLIIFGVAAAIDDRCIKNAPVFNPQRIALRIANLGAGRAVGDVVHLVLVDAKSTDRGGARCSPAGEDSHPVPQNAPHSNSRRSPRSHSRARWSYQLVDRRWRRRRIMFWSTGNAAATASAIGQFVPEGLALHQFTFPGVTYPFRTFTSAT